MARNDPSVRKHIPFTFKIGAPPPPVRHYERSPYGGTWKEVDNLEIYEVDTQFGNMVVTAGTSPWLQIECIDRHEARGASNSLHHWYRRERKGSVDWDIRVEFNDAETSLHVQKFRKARA